MQIQLTTELRQMARDVRALGRQAAFAQVVALTRTAADIKRAQQAEMAAVFDAPRAYTLGGVFTRPATKPLPEALVGLKTDAAGARGAATYLDPQIAGITRRTKAFERRLQLAHLMPAGSFSAPGADAPLDASGNLPRSLLVDILTQLGVALAPSPPRGSARVNRLIATGVKPEGSKYFSLLATRGRLPAGIYQRRAGRASRKGPKQLIRFVRKVNYARRYDFFGVAQAEADRAYPQRLDEALRQFADRTPSV